MGGGFFKNCICKSSLSGPAGGGEDGGREWGAGPAPPPFANKNLEGGGGAGSGGARAAAQLTEPRSGRQRVPRALCLPPPASPSPSPRSQQQPAEQPQQQRHGRVERLHRQPYGGRDLSGRGHRRLQGLALRLGRRPREDLR